MSRIYIDKNGHPLGRETVQKIHPEKLRDYTDIPINILPTHAALYEAIAEIMIETIVSKKGKKTTMILPVGPTAQYPLFAKKVKERHIDCRNLFTFNMDEFLDRTGRTISEDHPLSFKAEMMEKLFNLIPSELKMPAEQMFFPRHDNMEVIDQLFDEHAPDGVDLCLAGVGPEGHFAFNENPNSGHIDISEEEFLADRTHLVSVRSSTVDMDALVAGCGDRSAIPPFAVTIGPRDVLSAKRMEVILFAGKFQRTALRETLFREPTMAFPGSYLKLRRKKDGSLEPQNVTVWATEEEAGPVTSQTI
jgi:glucosamine-6-phosphate deaminase